MNPRDVKRRANAIRKAITGEAYYDRKYKDLRVADLLLVLEDENYHTEETILEALANLDYYKIVEACKLEVEREALSELDYDDKDYAERSEQLHQRHMKLINQLRKGE